MTDLWMIENLGRGAGQGRGSLLHDDPIVADLQRLLGVLFDHHDRHPGVTEGLEQSEYLLDEDRGRPMNGSSMRSRRGWSNIARPTSSIFCSPPLNVPA